MRGRRHLWYAPEDMAIGDRIRKTIYAAIGRLDKLLIILSRNSIASEWVEGEVERAFERERRQKETILSPSVSTMASWPPTRPGQATSGALGTSVNSPAGRMRKL